MTVTDKRHGWLLIVALALVASGTVADDEKTPGVEAVRVLQTGERAPSGNREKDDDGNEESDDEAGEVDGQVEIGSVKEVFVPSEEITADSAISFPADI